MGIVSTPVYLYVHAAWGNAITLYDLFMPLVVTIFVGVLTYKPVSMFSIFTVDGSKVWEHRIGKKAAWREADLNARDVRLYLWINCGIRWLIVTSQACESGKAAKELYKQEKAMMIPYEFRLNKVLKLWADKAREIS